MLKRQKRAGTSKDLYRRFACQADHLATRIYTAAGSEFGTQMLKNLKSGSLAQVVSATVNPQDYTNADTFFRDYLCAELMSKFPHWELGIDRTAAALKKFSDSEEVCAATNTRLLSPSGSIVIDGFSTDVLFHVARRKISRLLGSFSWNEAAPHFSFGPGATTSLKKRHGDAYYKLGAKSPDASFNLEPLVEAYRHYNANCVWEVNYISASRVTTVPKNAKTDRSICIEPDLNMFFQKGLGTLIRRRLRRVGLLLPTAQEINAAAAKEGSLKGHLATIDLSSASDTVSLEIVRQLLPADWCEALEQCRTPFTRLPCGEVKLLRKFSSMGNGYTFELETLIFWGLCSSVYELIGEREHRPLVFGDDIIVKSSAAGFIIRFLEFCGFATNDKKTFIEGPFRESCGKHYFNGSDVTPFYVRDKIDKPERLFWALNRVHMISRLSWGLDPRWRPAYDFLYDRLPHSARRLRVPDGMGDIGIVSDFDAACPHRARRGWSGYRFKGMISYTLRRQPNDRPRLLKSLYLLEKGVPSGELDSSVPTLTRSTLKELFSPSWPSFGPWLED